MTPEEKAREAFEALPHVDGLPVALVGRDGVGDWVCVWAIPGTEGPSWSIHPMVSISRWATKETAEIYATFKRETGTDLNIVSAVIPWGDGDLYDGCDSATPENLRFQRVCDALNGAA